MARRTRHPIVRARIGGRRIAAAARQAPVFAAGMALILLALLLSLGTRHLPGDELSAVVIAGLCLTALERTAPPLIERPFAGWLSWLRARAHPLRTWRRAAWVPPVLGVMMAAAGAASVLAAFAPGWLQRTSMLATLGAPVLDTSADVARLPLGVALIAIAGPVAKRRARAWPLAVSLLVAIAVLDLLRGPAGEEALLMLVLAALTVTARQSFFVAPCPATLISAMRRAPLILGGTYAIAVGAVWAASGHATAPVTWTRACAQAADMLMLLPGPLAFTGGMRWLPYAVGSVGVLGLLAAVWVLARPVRIRLTCTDDTLLRQGVAIVRASGTDTLSFFKLRRDTQHLFSRDGRAMAACRIRGGVLVLSGDPVGPPDAVRALIRDIATTAERHGLKLAILGAAPAAAGVYRDAGLRRLYLGDEAIVDTRTFSLDGRPIRKVRQSVTRLERAGYRLELRVMGDIAAGEMAELDRISDAWRRGVAERGFSMALDEVGGWHQADTVLVLARDGGGAIRGFLHLVPCYGRPTVSLAAMRRDPATPNGLTEFMIGRGIGLLRERGIEELSLNFVVFGRAMREPTCAVERVVGRAVRWRMAAGFQIASLHRFNAKFFPRWERRDLWYEGRMGLPRAALAALAVEGQLPFVGGGDSGRSSRDHARG